jgi:hypothetical protein
MFKKRFGCWFRYNILVSSPNADAAQLPKITFGKYPKMSNSTPASLASWLT